MRRKADLPSKTCATCGRPFAWRKKWAKVWDEVALLLGSLSGRETQTLGVERNERPIGMTPAPPDHSARHHPSTPDNRYFVVRGRLWRLSNPSLTNEKRDVHVRELMAARRAVRAAAGNRVQAAVARARVDAAKHALGERGAPWWTDGAPDYNRRMARNTPYASWFAELDIGTTAT